MITPPGAQEIWTCSLVVHERFSDYPPSLVRRCIFGSHCSCSFLRRVGEKYIEVVEHHQTSQKIWRLQKVGEVSIYHGQKGGAVAEWSNL